MLGRLLFLFATFILLPVSEIVARIGDPVFPVPDTVSVTMQKLVGAPRAYFWNEHPKNLEEWEELVNDLAARNVEGVNALKTRLGVSITPEEIAGVKVFAIAPEKIAPENDNRMLLYIHGGGYVLNPGEAGLAEAVLMANAAGIRIIAVDYRLAPRHPFPAAIDDVMAVYKTLLSEYPAKNIGVFGTSTGGGLALSLVQSALKDNIPVPGAVAAGTPWSDLSMTGDSYATNDGVDNILVSYNGWLKDAALAYAGGKDLKDPALSPVYGDVKGFPPVLLTTGTRDLFLSNTVRMHKKLREAKIPADLVVLEGQSHAQYYMAPDAPETAYYFFELKNFFDKYLGK